MSTERALQDIETIKEFIKRGRSRMVDNGFFFIFWGILIPAAVLVNFLLNYNGIYGFEVWFWPVVGIGGGIVSGMKGSHDSKARKTNSYADRIHGQVWLALLLALLAAYAGLFLSAVVFKRNFAVVEFLSAISLLLGTVVWIHSVIIRMNWLKIISAGWWLTAIAVMLTSSSEPIYASVVMGIATIILNLIPGLILRKISEEKNEAA
ncbi:MAG: hypothetical protein PF637_10815 [Spirochaetes bacterium]|jgi:hypothetical protein|nr:hypothetical protein [Spirochaetota bacterium]